MSPRGTGRVTEATSTTRSRPRASCPTELSTPRTRPAPSPCRCTCPGAGPADDRPLRPVLGLPAGVLRRPRAPSWQARPSGCAGTPSSSVPARPPPTTTSRARTRSSRPSPSPSASWRAHDDSLASVEAWWKPIAENERFPAWLRTAALNELYHLVFNASFWEAGLVLRQQHHPVPSPRRASPGVRDPRHAPLLLHRRRQRRRHRQRDGHGQRRLPRLRQAVPEHRDRPHPRLAAAGQAEPGGAGARSRSSPRPVRTSARRRPSRANRQTRRTSSARRLRAATTSASCSRRPVAARSGTAPTS